MYFADREFARILQLYKKEDWGKKWKILKLLFGKRIVTN